MTRPFTLREQIAIAITHAMRDNVEPLQLVLKQMKNDGWNDYDIGTLFMEIGALIFNDKEEEPND